MKRSNGTAIDGTAIDDIRLDGNGRVAVGDAELAERLAVTQAAQRRKPAPDANLNCVNFCNVKQGCGPVNKKCSPNTVANCGCRSA